MIYSFVDTNGCPSDTALPAEAMNFNGVFLENEIEGYRTLYVSGRNPWLRSWIPMIPEQGRERY